jgi:hypothetical protein
MNPNKWEQLVFLAEEKLGIDKREKQELEVGELSDGSKIMGTKEIIEFKSPLGKIKMEKITRPKVVDKKVLHTKRIGGRVAVDYVYSPDEKVEEVNIYLQNKSGEWEEIDLEKMGLN